MDSIQLAVLDVPGLRDEILRGGEVPLTTPDGREMNARIDEVDDSDGVLTFSGVLECGVAFCATLP